MKAFLNYIGLVGYPCNKNVLETHQVLYHWLIRKGYEVMIEYQLSKELLSIKSPNIGNLSKIGQCCDLAIVVGGDGNLLCAGYILSSYNIKIIGINRGNLGFLTDLNPDTALQQLSDVLSGQFTIENRFLLDVHIFKKLDKLHVNTVINEAVLHSEKVAHMIEFEVYIDEHFAFSQRSDGLIISTPTGSTGYSLSAGGPILEASLEAIVLVPMFPHTLSARPLVVKSSSIIYLKFPNWYNELKISCDSQRVLSINSQDTVVIRRSHNSLNLIHPKNYSYFNTLTTKLNWLKKYF
ncbi:NAD(+) kinase [Buchnera aphidicola (Formosaphis micheliae)]|uniref:NAD(+) kinase n=1 Tax=Buchnera aphidicola TaxID=9 RepID=UPI0031CCD271